MIVEKKKREARNGYTLTDRAQQILNEVKNGMGIDKSKTVSFALEYADENKEGFTDFIRDKMLESLKKLS